MWKGEAAFRLKKGTALPETIQQQLATKTQPRSTPQKVTQVIRHNPRTQLRKKTTLPTTQISAAPHTTKGQLQKYIMGETTGTEKAHTALRQTLSDLLLGDKVQPVGERHNRRLVEDEWTTLQAKTSDKPWTGWTHQEFPTQLGSDDKEQQQGTKAKVVQAPK